MTRGLMLEGPGPSRIRAGGFSSGKEIDMMTFIRAARFANPQRSARGSWFLVRLGDIMTSEPSMEKRQEKCTFPIPR